MFLLFLFFDHDYIIYIDLAISQLKTQQLMTSQYNTILCYSFAHFVLKIDHYRDHVPIIQVVKRSNHNEYQHHISYIKKKLQYAKFKLKI